MIEIIEGISDNILVARATGKVTRADYDVALIPAIEDKLRRYEKIRLLYELGKDFSSFTAGAMWDDAKIGVRHLTAFEKVAVVSDVEWIVGAVKVFAFLMPCPVRTFRASEMSLAQQWLSE